MDALAGFATGAAQGTQYLGPNANARLDREQRASDREKALAESKAEREQRAKERADDVAFRREQADLAASQAQFTMAMANREAAQREVELAQRDADRLQLKEERAKEFKLKQGSVAFDKLNTTIGKGLDFLKLRMAEKQAAAEEKYRNDMLDLNKRTFDDNRAKIAYDRASDAERLWLSIYKDNADRAMSAKMAASEFKNGIALSTGNGLLQMVMAIDASGATREEKLRRITQAVEVTDTVRRTMEAAGSIPDIGSEDGFKSAQAMADALREARKKSTDAIAAAGLSDPAATAALGSSVFNAHMETFLANAEKAGLQVPPKPPSYVPESVEKIIEDLQKQAAAESPTTEKKDLSYLTNYTEGGVHPFRQAGRYVNASVGTAGKSILDVLKGGQDFLVGVAGAKPSDASAQFEKMASEARKSKKTLSPREARRGAPY